VIILIWMKFKYAEYIDSSMSSLYFWGKPVTSRLFQTQERSADKAFFDQPIEQLACGEKHCAFVAEGAAFGFGDNSEGQLG
jgi:alpha-tubulin suppressor-like RCC1 family protein